METHEITEAMIQNDWAAKTNEFGLWIVGPEKNGIINVLGMGRSFREAFEMAFHSKEKV